LDRYRRRVCDHERMRQNCNLTGDQRGCIQAPTPSQGPPRQWVSDWNDSSRTDRRECDSKRRSTVSRDSHETTYNAGTAFKLCCEKGGLLSKRSRLTTISFGSQSSAGPKHRPYHLTRNRTGTATGATFASEGLGAAGEMIAFGTAPTGDKVAAVPSVPASYQAWVRRYMVALAFLSGSLSGHRDGSSQ